MARSLVWLVLALAGCERAAPSPAPPAAASVASSTEAAVRALSRRLGEALRDGDADALAALSRGRVTEVRVEIRQSLAETDERLSRTLSGAAALAEWLARSKAEWSCAGDACKWPGGLVVGALDRCLGDCCHSDHPNGIEKRTLYLRRVCWAAREGDEARLSYLGFVEAR